MFNNVRDRLLQVRLMRDEQEVKIALIVIGTLVLILLGNLLYLNYNLVNKPSQNESTKIVLPIEPTGVSDVPTAIVPSITDAPVGIPQAKTQTESLIKDYFVPLGSGVNQTSDFADVAGLQAAVDLGAYQNIKEIRFEASITVPTANQWVSVRLFNVTDKHPVWYSEVTSKGGASSYLISEPIAYDLGLKTYQVQMKTQLQYPANLTQSRIHIILK